MSTETHPEPYWQAGNQPADNISTVTASEPGQFLIWSNQHRAWWGPNHVGFTRWIEEAGRYSQAQATEIVNSATVGGTLTRKAYATFGSGEVSIVDEWAVPAPEGANQTAPEAGSVEWHAPGDEVNAEQQIRTEALHCATKLLGDGKATSDEERARLGALALALAGHFANWIATGRQP